MTSATDNILSSFTPLLPPRRYWSPIESYALCPSMDLLAVALEDGTVMVQRTISTGTLATFVVPLCSHVCWSPDGRMLAVVVANNQVNLYVVEDFMQHQQPTIIMDQEQSCRKLHFKHDDGKVVVTGIYWAHAGRPHPAWETDEDDKERDYAAALMKPRKQQPWLILDKNDSSDETLQALSIIYIATNLHITLYAHGRYPFVRIPLVQMGMRVKMKASLQLSHVLLQSRTKLILYSIPQLAQHTLSPIALLDHWQALVHARQQIASAFKAALAPLDLKFNGLLQLLIKYNVVATPTTPDSIATCLVQYIVASSNHPVLEQYLASLNDALVLRLQTSVLAALRLVETSVRAAVRRACKLLFLDSSLQTATRPLCVAWEGVLAAVVDARVAVHDVTTWLRLAKAQCKATNPANSTKLPAATSNGVVDRVLQRCCRDPIAGGTLTEVVLRIPVSCLLEKETGSAPSLAMHLGATKKAIDSLMDAPRTVLQRSVVTTELELEQLDIVATTMRLGKGGVDAADGCFAPMINGNTRAVDVKEWLVIAHAVQETHVTIHALPLCNESRGTSANYFWSTLLTLPNDCSIQRLVFYGDDGKSSLSGGSDTSKERRQALSLLVNRQGVSELWLVSYDDCVFRKVFFKNRQKGRIGLSVDLTDYGSSYLVVPTTTEVNQNETQTVLYAKTRVLGQSPHDYLVCGSRGIGAVVSSPATVELFDLEEDEEREEDNMSTDE